MLGRCIIWLIGLGFTKLDVSGCLSEFAIEC